MKIFIFFAFFSCVLSLNSIEKPVLKSGSHSYVNFNKNDNYDLYPSSIKDTVYASISEDFNDYFTFKYKTEFDYSNYNKYVSDIDDLNSLAFVNHISFYVNIPECNSFLFYLRPGMKYQYGERYFTDTAVIQYKLKLKYFSFVTYYSNRFMLKEKEFIYHKFNLSFYWSIPSKNFLKFKTSVNVTLQNPLYEMKDFSPLDNIGFSFEMAIDFNKVNFEEVFKQDEDEDIFD